MFNLGIKTPVWTGNIEMKGDLLQPTGIMGSLRWWFEVIMRGMDKYACDPTGNERCPKKDKEKEKEYYCPACIVFGATGMRRMFRLVVDGGKSVFSGSSINIKPSGRNRGWHLGSGLKGKIKMDVIVLDKDFDKIMVLVPLIIASKWGGIGAKTQHGYGVVEIENSPGIDAGEFIGTIEKIARERSSKLGIALRHESNNGLPDIKEMFFAKVQFEVNNDDWWKNIDGLHACADSGSVPIAPTVKNWLRFKGGARLWSTTNQVQDKRIENYLFGTTERTCAKCYNRVERDKDNSQNFWCPNCKKSLKKEDTFERIASKINISCAYKMGERLWEFRIWGWIPKDDLPVGYHRENFLNNLKQSLTGSGSTPIPWNNLLGDQTKNHKLKVWREFASSRDTVKQNESNIENYLQSLLNGEGG